MPCKCNLSNFAFERLDGAASKRFKILDVLERRQAIHQHNLQRSRLRFRGWRQDHHRTSIFPEPRRVSLCL